MGRSNTSQTTTQQLDPETRARMGDLWNRGTEYVGNTPYEAYPGGGRVAGFSPMQLQAQDYLSGAVGAGVPEAQQAAGIAGGIAQGGAAPQVQAGNLMQGIGMYRDPYEDQVVSTALTDIDRSRQLAVQGGNSAATMAGAFGGDRSAIVEAETNRAYADQAARTAAQLRSQGFTTAAALAESDASRGMTADVANQGAYFAGRGQQLQGAGLLSATGGDIYNRQMGSADALSRMGGQQQNQAQAELSDDVSRFLEERGYNWEQIQRLQSLFSGFPYGQTQTTTQPGGSRTAGALGGAAAGAGGGFMIGGPLGAGIGAGVGGLLGLF